MKPLLYQLSYIAIHLELFTTVVFCPYYLDYV